MPRPRRIDLPGIPQHVVQRGHDRQPRFFAEADYFCYRTTLREIALREGCAVHAFVLMTNHVHLLLTPQQPNAVARDPATRQQAYRSMVMDAVDPADVASIRRHLQRQHAYGSDRFRKIIEVQLGRSVGPQKIGQPSKEQETGDRNPAAG